MSIGDALQESVATPQGAGAEPAAAAPKPTEAQPGGEQVSEPGPSPAEIEAEEARAKSTGWRGPSPKFPDAKSWNEYAEDNLPLIQTALRKQEAELEKLRKSEEERERRVEERIARAVKIAQEAFDRQQTNDRAAFVASWERHVDLGDTPQERAVRRAQMRTEVAKFDAQAAKEREAREAEAKLDAGREPGASQLYTEEDAAAFEKWKSENEWWETDEDLTAYAQGLVRRGLTAGLSVMDGLAKVTAKVRSSPLYLAKHGRSEPPRASAVGTAPPCGPNGQFVADNVSKLSAEERRDFDYLWKSLNGAPYQGETDKEKALRKYADRLRA